MRNLQEKQILEQRTAQLSSARVDYMRLYEGMVRDLAKGDEALYPVTSNQALLSPFTTVRLLAEQIGEDVGVPTPADMASLIARSHPHAHPLGQMCRPVPTVNTTPVPQTAFMRLPLAPAVAEAALMGAN